MALSIQERHLVDRYLNGELSGIEMEEYNLKLGADEQFRKEAELQQLIYEGVFVAREQQLEDMIKASVNYRKPLVPFALKLIFTFFVITFLGITLWLYVGNEPVKTQIQQFPRGWFSFFMNTMKNDKTEKKAVTTKQKSGAEQKTELNAETDSTSSDTKDGEDLAENATGQQDEANAGDSLKSNPGSEDEIVVKKDQLLASVELPVDDKSGKQADESLANEAAKKLNPASDLPEEESKTNAFHVEFWASPINYKGYKMSKNNIVLFGIDETENVKLFRLSDALYMSYQKGYYKLGATNDFTAYQKLKESEIPAELK